MLIIYFISCATDDKKTDDTYTQIDLVNPHCEETATAITTDEEVMGVTGEDFLNTIPINSSTHITWQDSMDFECLYSAFITDQDSFEYVSSTYVEGNSGIEIGVTCYDYIRVQGTLLMSNEDDAFSVEFPLELQIVPEDGSLPESVPFSGQLSQSEAEEVLALEEWIDLENADLVTLNLTGNMGSNLMGELSILVERSTSQTSSIEQVVVAELGHQDSDLVCDAFE
jgi:hypothetical protein